MYPYCLPGVQAANAQTCARRLRAMPPFRGARPIPSDFEDRYDSISARRSRARRTGHVRPFDADRPLDERLKALIADQRYIRDLKKARLEHGYAHPGGTLGTDWVGPFTETGLRSERLGFIAKRFVAATARKVESGGRKDRLAAGSSKLLGLDDPYIRLNRRVVSGFRIDVDARFASFDDLHRAVARCGLPALPNLVVARRDASGKLHNPHLWYFLPDTAAVWIEARANPRLIALLHRVIAGVTAALLPIGADPGGLANPFHGKNPLSPLFSTESWNDSRFLTLADWADSVDLRAKGRTDLSGPARRGEILHGSNSVGRTLFGWAVEALREARDRDDPTYRVALGDRSVLGRYLADLLRRDAVIHLGWDDERGLQSQCRRIAERWDADRIARRKNRGALRARMPVGIDLADRQRAGQAHTAAIRRRNSLAAVLDALVTARSTGEIPTQSGVARSTGLARSTVARHWATALASDLSRSVLRKKGSDATKPARSRRAPDQSRRQPPARRDTATPPFCESLTFSSNAPSPSIPASGTGTACTHPPRPAGFSCPDPHGGPSPEHPIDPDRDRPNPTGTNPLNTPRTPLDPAAPRLAEPHPPRPPLPS